MTRLALHVFVSFHTRFDQLAGGAPALHGFLEHPDYGRRERYSGAFLTPAAVSRNEQDEAEIQVLSVSASADIPAASLVHVLDDKASAGLADEKTRHLLSAWKLM